MAIETHQVTIGRYPEWMKGRPKTAKAWGKIN